MMRLKWTWSRLYWLEGCFRVRLAEQAQQAIWGLSYLRRAFYNSKYLNQNKTSKYVNWTFGFFWADGFGSVSHVSHGFMCLGPLAWWPVTLCATDEKLHTQTGWEFTYMLFVFTYRRHFATTWATSLVTKPYVFFSIWTCAQARTEFRLEGSDSEDDPGAFLQWTTYETVCAMHLKDWFCIYSAWRHGGSGLTKLKTYDLQMLTKNGLKKWLEMSSKTLKKMSMIFVLPRKVGPNNKMEHTCEAMKSWTLRSALLTLRRAEVPQVTWIVFYMIACWMLFW